MSYFQMINIFMLKETDPACSISRPMKELKFFCKKEIKSVVKVLLTLEIDPGRDLCYADPRRDRILERGDFYAHVNGQKLKFELTKYQLDA